ncbi:MAG: hypothetical protein SNJ55_07025 [Chloroherpetonaceae bacterium]
MQEIKHHHQYAPLTTLAKLYEIPVSTLKVRLCFANKSGIPLPPRRRIGRQFFYDVSEFERWLWETSKELQRDYQHGSENE